MALSLANFPASSLLSRESELHSESSRGHAQTKTSSMTIMIGSQPSFFHGILMLSFPIRPFFRANGSCR
uniref:Uncharacterized protein n=1 Tax=Arundo donax TaxID=35708 RepID=A0A0A9D4T6_ARUDO